MNIIADNDPKQTSAAVCRETIESNDINWIRMPPYSPDFNIIENLWASLKKLIGSRASRTKEELLKIFQTFFFSLNKQICQLYVNRFKEVCKQVKAKYG